MHPILTRCGYRCDLCLAYHPNVVQHPENRQILSDGWFTYFGFRIPPEQIHCDGCMSEHPHLIDQECPVRPCVIQRGLQNCADCNEYICPKLRKRLVTFEEIELRLGHPIPHADRQRFIEPYENQSRLERLRAM